jgi:hypothetical protein
LVSAGGNEQATVKRRITSGKDLSERMAGHNSKDITGMAALRIIGAL